MKIKNKKRFIFYILLYIIGFLYFHVVGGFVDNLVRWLFSDDSIEDLLTALEITFGAWLFVLGLPLTILYIVWKKTGHSATYRTVADIMTEEEFARWQDKKKRRADKWRAIKERWRNGGR